MAYTSLSVLKDYLGIPNGTTSEDTPLTAAINAAQDLVDGYTNTTFETVTEARGLFEEFLSLVTDDNSQIDLDAIGKLAVFEGVRDYPTRVKCASLAWHTLRAAVEDRHEAVTTE